ncbi:DUF2441 domain-containing protein [Paenibacillus macerans]|uniref:DUF2441 domain-containing protein n=1 Tax=Paenibacillus macerans TaxID=44252 RepID=UPI003D31C121
MDRVNGETFYHIQRKHDEQRLTWNVGDKIEIGSQNNNFFSSYESNGKSIQDPNNGKLYDINIYVDEMMEYYKTGKQKPEYEFFYQRQGIHMANIMKLTLEHYIKLVREMAFEDVRKEHFPEYPSRQKCIWVIPDITTHPGMFDYWWSTLGVGRVFKLRLTGKIHRANQEFLLINTRSLVDWKERAYMYWFGEEGTNPNETEYLFEGLVEVVDEMTVVQK